MRPLLFAFSNLLIPVMALAAMEVSVQQPDWAAPGEARNLIVSIYNTGNTRLHNVPVVPTPQGVTLRANPPVPFNLVAHASVAIHIPFQAPQQEEGHVAIDISVTTDEG